MQHVASPSVHHSQHHGVEARGRAPASEPKQPTTPFSLLLDGADDAPPPRPKQPDDATQPPRRAGANDQTRSEQTQAQQSPEEAPTPKAAGADEATEEQTPKSAGTAEEPAVATTGEDETKTADATTNAAADATADAQPAAAVVVPTLPPAPPAPAEADDNAGIDAASLAKAAAAGLKADQPATPKGKAEQNAATGPSGTDESQAADAAPAADAQKAADPIEAPKSQAPASAAKPDQDKPEHTRAHEAASRGEARSTDELANPPTATTQAADSTPTGKPADGTQLVNTQQQADRTANAAAPAAPAPNTGSAVPLAGLAVEIAARAQGGHNRFEIRLDPPELGKIHVSLDVDKSGQVTSRLVVDRAETLDALRRDAANLERALQDAGLKTGDNGMQFTLRDQSFAGHDDGSTPANAARLVVPDPDLAPVEATSAGYGRLLRAGGGVDIRV